jgi:hypothetical protein
MFELNRVFIRKVGWSEYIEGYWRPTITFKKKLEEEEVVYYIQPIKSKETYLISKYLDKQNGIIKYKFIIANSRSEIDLLKSTKIEINSNLDLMKVIKDYEACNEEYQRHFKLTKLLK